MSYKEKYLKYKKKYIEYLQYSGAGFINTKFTSPDRFHDLLTGSEDKSVKAAKMIDILSQMDENDFIIVGGGPVGLQTAYKLIKSFEEHPFKLKGSEYKKPNIYIIEYRQETKRGQILSMSPIFWSELDIEIKVYLKKHTGLCLYNKNPDSNPIDCHEIDDNFLGDENFNANVKLDILQDAYYNYLNGIENVHLIMCNVLTPEILKFSPVVNIILSDGGGKDSVTQKLFKYDYEIILSYALIITFTAAKNMANQSNYKEILGYNFKQDNWKKQILTHFVQNSVNPSESGSGYISLQICKDSYDKLKCYIEKNKLNDKSKVELIKGNQPDFVGIPEKILLNKVLELYEVQEYTSCSLIPISLRSATDFYTRKGDQFYFLVGDSAFTTHFFTGTGMNRGFASSTMLLNLLTKPTFNRELLATLYNLSQKKIRDKLWSEIIPSYIFNACKLMNECMEDDRAECYYDKLKINGKELKDYVEENLINKFTDIYFNLFSDIQTNVEKQFINPQPKRQNVFDTPPSSDSTMSVVTGNMKDIEEAHIEKILYFLTYLQKAPIIKDFSKP
jgi:hypothetical protein